MFGDNNQFISTQFGRDRQGFVTPDPDASEPMQPFLPNSHPAPWLPKKRLDDAHPNGASKVVSIGNIIGLDKCGGLIPAGLLSGSQPASAFGDTSGYCLLKYDANDVGFVINPKTGLRVAADGEYVLIAAPSNAAATTVVDGVAVTADDIAWALTCDLVPGGVARGIGYAMKDMYANINGIKVLSTTGGIEYLVESMNPLSAVITGYSHEPGQAVRSSFVLRMPWIGATPTTLQTLLDPGLTGLYSQTDFSRSFVHFVGTKGNAAGQLFPGCLVVPAHKFGAKEAGNYMPFDPTIHTIDNVVGQVLGIENLYPQAKVLDKMDTVRTQFERASRQMGPFAEKNWNTQLMGGSATRGMATQVSYGTNGAFRIALDNGKAIKPEYHTVVYVKVRL